MRIFGSLGIIAVFLLITKPAYALVSTTTRVATGLGSPLFATFAPGDTNHLFVLEQGGNIKVVDLTTKLVVSTFLNIPDTDAAGEGGLLGLAFHPDYAKVGSPNKGKFYVYVTVDNGGVSVPAGTAASAVSPFSTHIRQYSVSMNPLLANTAPTEVLSWARPQTNHVGGWIGFSPKDGYLYIDSGDGGASNDSAAGHFEPGGNAQTITNDLMGKQLRIDINSDDFPAVATRNYAIPSTNPFAGASVTGDDEIWSYGLRNPYRASFDRVTGDLWIGDVGQDTREEIDFQPAVRSGVSNYGWRLREGNIQTPATGIGGAIPANYVAPVYDYTHGSGSLQGNAVIGGYVYRGPDPSLQGTYFFADEVSGHVWSMNTSTFAVTNIDTMLTPDVGSLSGPSSFAEDAVGNLYLVSYGNGNVFRINTTQLLKGDFDANGVVNDADYTMWRAGFGAANPNPASDGNGNAIFDAADYVAWRKNLGISVHAGAGAGAAVPELTTTAYLLELFGVTFSLALLYRRPRLATIGACSPRQNLVVANISGTNAGSLRRRLLNDSRS